MSPELSSIGGASKSQSSVPWAAARATSPRPTLLHILFLLAVFFPYIQLVPMDTDVQPAALFLSLVIMLFERRWTAAPANLWLLGCMFLVALCVLFVGDLEFAAFRSIGNYASIFFISLAPCRSRAALPHLRLARGRTRSDPVFKGLFLFFVAGRPALGFAWRGLAFA